MALDGIYLNYLKNEIENRCIGARVDKVNQPSKEEIILAMRNRDGAFKLMLSVRANSPRVHITTRAPENPQNPPMLCMLLRKKLCGATLRSVRQIGLDRIVFLDFDATNEIGDKVKLSLCVEIMAKYSNMILIDGNGVIVDSLKRVDSTKSSVREILPGLKYELPPSQGKLNLLDCDIKQAVERIKSQENKTLSGAVLSQIEGVSPIVARELSALVTNGDGIVSELDSVCFTLLEGQLEKLKENIIKHSGEPCIVFDGQGKPKDFSFFDITQYGNSVKKKAVDGYSELLDEFYSERDSIERMRHKAQDLFKFLNSSVERVSKKINTQRAELKQCDDRETLRVYAELITANQYQLPKGVAFYEVENYYDEGKLVRIPCNQALSPTKNAQKYYKDYKKAFTAEKMLKEQIEQGENELQYFNTVLDCLSRAETEGELTEIRHELENGGYLKKKTVKGKIKNVKALEPMKFVSPDGATILVGRNNIQNDRLTLKTAAKNDMWLHTKNIPGSHVIICDEGKGISDEAIEYAAGVAAYYSSGRNSTKVGVDYTLVKNIKKPNGAKPGMVIYETNYTVYVDPIKPEE